ncbi:MAG: VCBS repeat-containing protein [Saprospiraceae bacterium]|nr:VCBS repeat-containing protein [Saprospiraceae bacterium]
MLKYSFSILFLLLIGCNRPEGAAPKFELLRKAATGLDFDNTPQQSAEVNVFNYMYYFNGGGVAAGDFNQDGLIDLFFTSNMGPDKLFLNEGKLHFRDVTLQSNVNPGQPIGISWKTGASVVDINNDGLLDIYINQVGDYKAIKGRNRLLICQKIENGIPVFADKAAEWGLDLIGFGTQAAFFDYDLDGDLDLYQLNHSLHQNGTFGPKKQFEGTLHPLSGDKLMENREGRFVDVTTKSGIESTVIGYGLGIGVSDLNLDGWPDLYIGNDFHENDYYYINQQNGTFKESLAEAFQHTSRFSMGVDIADVNNDGWNDLISLDMEPEDPQILKASLGEDGFAVYQMKLGYGYHNQYARNALQLNDGAGHFQEIAQFAGVSATDWSWSPLFADFDSDGYKDLFISNGIPRRMNDVDFMRFQESKGEKTGFEKDKLAIVEKMPRIKLPNKFFHNSGHLKFKDWKENIVGDQPTFSNGAITADLDNDGDLDVVVNNIEDEPFVYKNLDREQGNNQNTFLSLQLKGSPQNLNAIGTRVIIFKKNGERLVEEFYPVRGYQSSAMTPLRIGIGDSNLVDSALVIWPDRTYERLLDLKFNSNTGLVWRPGLSVFDFSVLRKKPANPFVFKVITQEVGLDFTHTENPFIDFNREALIPHMVSAEGPALAVGDVNGDGLQDVFFGSSKFEKSALYLQSRNGTFTLNTPQAILNDSIFEDVDAVFADLENDGDLDLIVAAGGNEWKTRDEAMKQRYYLNDGQGNFVRRDFPGAFVTASCVLPCDFNKDGLIDFFIGARAQPWNYGLTPASYLFQNKGGGTFEDVTQKIGGGLQHAGLVKNGAWADLDADGDEDLLLAMEWEPLTVYLNHQGIFEKKPLNERSGWWNFALPYDFDGDGDLDILAGNIGQNGRFHPTPSEPVRMYVSDVDHNGQVDQILTYYLKNKELPFATFEEITKTIPSLKKKFLYAKDFSKASVSDIFGKDILAKAVHREVNTFESMFFENTGGMNFKMHPLPDQLQFSTLNACTLSDLNGDGRMEAILGGNFYECNIEMGRYDANFGNVLRFGKNGEMQVFSLGDLQIKGQVRRIEPLKIGRKNAFVFARNNEHCIVIQ